MELLSLLLVFNYPSTKNVAVTGSSIHNLSSLGSPLLSVTYLNGFHGHLCFDVSTTTFLYELA